MENEFEKVKDQFNKDMERNMALHSVELVLSNKSGLIHGNWIDSETIRILEQKFLRYYKLHLKNINRDSYLYSTSDVILHHFEKDLIHTYEDLQILFRRINE